MSAFVGTLRPKHLLTALALAVMMASTAAASPERFKPGFGDAGIRLLAGADTQATRVVATADGRLLVIVNSPFWASGSTTPLAGIWRLNADGTADESFGQTGFLSSRELCGGDCPITDLALIDDGFYVVAGGRVRRLASSGARVQGYGEGGEGAMPPGLPAFYAQRVAVAPGGSVLVAGARDADFLPTDGIVYRLRDLGAFDPTFSTHEVDDGGISDDHVLGMIVQADGKVVVLTRLRVMRILPDGNLDATFGTHGIVPGGGATLLVDGNQRILVAGIEHAALEDAVMAVRALKSDGSLDAQFGDGGVARIRSDRLDEDTYATSAAIDSEGRIVVVGEAGHLNVIPFGFAFRRIIVTRLLGDGTQDLHFAPGGSTAFWAGYRSTSQSVAVQSDGTIIVAGGLDAAPGPQPGKYPNYNPQATLYALKGGATAQPRTELQSLAIEYVNAQFNHYFFTTDSLEAFRLEAQRPVQWTRTGQAFRIWSVPGGDRVPVCRFWSDQAFAPKSSHFYTPYEIECLLLREKGSGPWVFEGKVSAFKLPVPSAGGLACPTGSRPLYRAYNNGLGGAPNHRFTVEATVLDEMIDSGWVMEGDAATRIFACVPSESLQ